MNWRGGNMNWTPEQIIGFLTAFAAVITSIGYLLHGHIQIGVAAVKSVPSNVANAITAPGKAKAQAEADKAKRIEDLEKIVADLKAAQSTPTMTATAGPAVIASIPATELPETS